MLPNTLLATTNIVKQAASAAQMVLAHVCTATQCNSQQVSNLGGRDVWGLHGKHHSPDCTTPHVQKTSTTHQLVEGGDVCRLNGLRLSVPDQLLLQDGVHGLYLGILDHSRDLQLPDAKADGHQLGCSGVKGWSVEHLTQKKGGQLAASTLQLACL